MQHIYLLLANYITCIWFLQVNKLYYIWYIANHTAYLDKVFNYSMFCWQYMKMWINHIRIMLFLYFYNILLVNLFFMKWLYIWIWDVVWYQTVCVFQTRVFTPVLGSCTSVTVDSKCTTYGVIKTLLEKFKVRMSKCSVYIGHRERVVIIPFIGMLCA